MTEAVLKTNFDKSNFFNKMNITEIIKNRRATPPRFMNTNEVSKELIQQLLENANWAPNHKHTEPWRFKVFTGKAKENLAESVFHFLDEEMAKGTAVNIQKAEKFRESLTRVPVVIAIVLQRDEAERIPEWEEIAAVSMAVQNMWLTAAEAGLGAFWATPPFLPLLNNMLNIQNGQQLLGFFYLGEIALDYPSPRRGSIESKVEWIDE